MPKKNKDSGDYQLRNYVINFDKQGNVAGPILPESEQEERHHKHRSERKHHRTDKEPFAKTVKDHGEKIEHKRRKKEREAKEMERDKVKSTHRHREAEHKAEHRGREAAKNTKADKNDGYGRVESNHHRPRAKSTRRDGAKVKHNDGTRIIRAKSRPRL